VSERRRNAMCAQSGAGCRRIPPRDEESLGLRAAGLEEGLEADEVDDVEDAVVVAVAEW
jgi:hypothetical protein